MKKASRAMDLKKVAKREKYFSTLAKEEGKGAQQRADKEEEAGLKEAAKDSRWETKVDRNFAKIRLSKASKAIKKLKKKWAEVSFGPRQPHLESMFVVNITSFAYDVK